MQCLEVVYYHQGLHTLCFTQMRLRSDHRRDLLAVFRCHIIQFTILDSIKYDTECLCGLSMIIRAPGCEMYQATL